MHIISRKPKKVSRVRVGQSYVTITNALFTCDIKKLVKHYTSIANRHLECKGPKWTCARLKAYYNIACRLCLHLDFDNIPFCRSKGKLPVELIPFEPYLCSDKLNRRRAALTVLRLYDLIFTKPTKDTSTIENEGPDESNFQTYSDHFDDMCELFKISLKPKLTDEYMYTTSKKGPNGPAMVDMDKDYSAIKASGLLETIKELNLHISNSVDCNLTREVALSTDFISEYDAVFPPDDITGISRYERKLRLYDSMECFMSWRLEREPNAYNNCCTSKLGFLSEGGCKTRVVAMGDYFSQDALKPIHRDLYRMLNRLSTDGTSSHNRISQVVKEQTSSRTVVWSFDLTSATDRFPIFIQEKVLSVMYGPEIARLWRRLMVDRDFVVDNSRTVRYKVGQPMGLLSSWATFALTHHIIIRTCALMVGKPIFNDYVVIGDDVTIFNDSVALKYMEFLDTFKIDISLAKSLQSRNKDLPCAEIAKRLFLGGQELSPLPHDAVESAIKNHLLFPNLIRLAMERDVITSSTQWKPVQNSLTFVYNCKRFKEVLLLISSPMQNLPIRLDSDVWDDFDSDLITSTFNDLKIEFIRYKAREHFMKNSYGLPDMGPLGIALNDYIDRTRLDFHPLLILLRLYRSRCRNIHAGISRKGIEASDIELIPFLVNPKLPHYMRKTHRIEKIRSTTILKTYRNLVSRGESHVDEK